jgi:hypothetical protein
MSWISSTADDFQMLKKLKPKRLASGEQSCAIGTRLADKAGRPTTGKLSLLVTAVQRIVKIETLLMLKPTKTRTVCVNGGTFVFVVVDNAGRQLFH